MADTVVKVLNIAPARGRQREKTTGAKASASESWGKAHMPQGVAKLADTPGRVELIFERWRKDVRCRRTRFSSFGAKRKLQVPPDRPEDDLGREAEAAKGPGVGYE